MHSSIYQEFDVSLSPSTEAKGSATPAEPVLYVKLKHRPSGDDFIFKLIGGVGSPERWIEEQVIRRFPLSTAAHQLRRVYGLTKVVLKDGWKDALGERMFKALAQSPIQDSKGARYWESLVPSLPSLLYSAMTRRVISNLTTLKGSLELRSVVKATHDAWLTVLDEARGIEYPLTGGQLIGFELNGWDSKFLRDMSLLEVSNLKDKAHFARLALGFLTDEDWVQMMSPVLTDAPYHTNL